MRAEDPLNTRPRHAEFLSDLFGRQARVFGGEGPNVAGEISSAPVVAFVHLWKAQLIGDIGNIDPIRYGFAVSLGFRAVHDVLRGVGTS